jgi:hypothetical protein
MRPSEPYTQLIGFKEYCMGITGATLNPVQRHILFAVVVTAGIALHGALELLEALPPSCRDAVIAPDAARDFLLPGFHQLARHQAVQHRLNAAVLDWSGLFDKEREEYIPVNPSILR